MYESQLETPADRFLSICLQHALTESWLTPAEFNEEFPVNIIIESLESDDELRAQLLVEAAGVHEKIAAKKSTAAAIEDLQLALNEGICTPETILDIYNMDDHVHYLERDELWAFLVRDAFWTQSSERARERLLFTLNTALDQELINVPRLINAIDPTELARLLPRSMVETVFSAAVTAGMEGRIYDADLFLAAVPLADWLHHVPLKLIWEHAVEGEIVPAAQLEEEGVEAADELEPAEEVPPSKRADAAPKSSRPPKAKPPAQEVVPANPAEEEARSKAISHLESMDRLPKRAKTLSTPVLLALAAMYDEFFELDSEEDQADCIRESFPNPKLLKEGLLAIAETLDPRLNEEQLRNRGADAAGLIQLVLFEERRIARQTNSSPPGGVPVATAPKVSKVPPPPLPSAISPKVGSAPPPPPAAARKVSVPPPPLPAQANRRN